MYQILPTITSIFVVKESTVIREVSQHTISIIQSWHLLIPPYCSSALVLGWREGKNTANKEKKSMVCFQPLLKQNDHARSSASTLT